MCAHARAMEGTCLGDLIELAVPLCRLAQGHIARAGPGCPVTFKDWQIAVLIVVAILKGRKSKSAQYRYLRDHKRDLQERLHLVRFPSRSTYFQRYRRLHEVFGHGIILQAQQAIEERVVDPTTVAVDKSLLAARGKPWHRRKGRPVKLTRGTDPEAAWGYSQYHGWVYGYSFETIVSAGKDAQVFPLVASVASANESESHSFLSNVPHVPTSTRHVLADRGYDTNANGDAVEFDQQDRPTGRRFICPLQARGGKPKVGVLRRKGRREQLRQRRQCRLDFFQSDTGRRLYEQRGRTVEPFHAWFKERFCLTERAWHRGLANNQTQILAAMFGYQLLVRYNHNRGNRNGRIQWILDTL